MGFDTKPIALFVFSFEIAMNLLFGYYIRSRNSAFNQEAVILIHTADIITFANERLINEIIIFPIINYFLYV